MTWNTAMSALADRPIRRSRLKGYSFPTSLAAVGLWVASSIGAFAAQVPAQAMHVAASVIEKGAAPSKDDDGEAGAAAEQKASPGKDASADDDDGEDDDEDKFPQPVRVGDLIGRAVVAPQESQNLIGHIRKVVAKENGDLSVVMTYGGYFGFGTHLVCVSIDDLALTGYALQAKEIDASELARLPVCNGSSDKPLDPEAIIKVNLAKPAH